MRELAERCVCVCAHYGYMNHSWCSQIFLAKLKKKNSNLNCTTGPEVLFSHVPKLYTIYFYCLPAKDASAVLTLMSGSSVLSSPIRPEVLMVCSSMCGLLQLSLTISWATNHPKHPQLLLDSALPHTVHLFLKPPPPTFTLGPPPASVPLGFKKLVTFWHFSGRSLSP